MRWDITKYVDIGIYTQFKDFASQKNISGYQKLPSGLILQWGIVNHTAGGPALFINFDYPIAFPNEAFILVANQHSSTAGQMVVVGHCKPGKKGGSVMLSDRVATSFSAGAFCYYVIGY